MSATEAPLPVTRKKIREVLPALLVFGDAAEDIFQPGPFINTACLIGGKQGVYDGGSLGGFVIAADQKKRRPTPGSETSIM